MWRLWKCCTCINFHGQWISIDMQLHCNGSSFSVFDLAHHGILQAIFCIVWFSVSLYPLGSGPLSPVPWFFRCLGLKQSSFWAAASGNVSLATTIMAFGVLETTLPLGQVVPSSTAVAPQLPIGKSDTLHTEGRSVTFLELLHVLCSGFLTQSYLQFPLQSEVWFRKQMLLHRFTPQPARKSVPECLVQIFSKITMCG